MSEKREKRETPLHDCFFRLNSQAVRFWHGECYKGKRKAIPPNTTQNPHKKMNLPNLTGTEKQINWANEIRSRLFRATSTESIIAHIQNEAAAGRVTEADIDRVLGKFGELNEATIAKIVGDFFADKTSAAYWIESRHETSLTDKVYDAIFA